jgi:peptidoglycan hydrolase-like protein with peptidoglycan-binding domain
MTENGAKRFVESRALMRSLIASFAVSALLLSLPEISYLPSVQAQPPKASQGSVPSNTKKQGSSSTSSPKKKKSSKQVAKKRGPRGQREIESSRVLEIQKALGAAGFYKDEPSGKWDPSTSQAMSAYQESNGFKATGKPDALSLKRLGL